MLYLFLNVAFLMCLVVLIDKVLTIEKHTKKNQGHIADLYQGEIDRLTKEIKEK